MRNKNALGVVGKSLSKYVRFIFKGFIPFYQERKNNLRQNNIKIPILLSNSVTQ